MDRFTICTIADRVLAASIPTTISISCAGSTVVPSPPDSYSDEGGVAIKVLTSGTWSDWSMIGLFNGSTNVVITGLHALRSLCRKYAHVTTTCR